MSRFDSIRFILGEGLLVTMKVGFLTDSHLGLNSDSEREEKLEIIRDTLTFFNKRNVEKVVHLGDVFDDKSNEPVQKLLDEFNSVIDEFEEDFSDIYITPGNHDVMIENKSEIKELFTLNEVIVESSDESTLLIDTVSKAKHDNLGYIPDSAKELLHTKMSSKERINIISHYPLAYTHVGARVFDVFPERAFPTNKKDIYDINETYTSEVSELFCGHLHPDSTQNTIGKPIGCQINVFEPITVLDLKGETLLPSPNTNLEMENLIKEL